MTIRPFQQIVLFVGLAGALALVFAMYGQPDFLMMLAKQMWSCF